jgi:hypothetical protein
MDERRWFRKRATVQIGRWIRSIKMPGLKFRKTGGRGDETYQRQLHELLEQIKEAKMLEL